MADNPFEYLDPKSPLYLTTSSFTPEETNRFREAIDTLCEKYTKETREATDELLAEIQQANMEPTNKPINDRPFSDYQAKVERARRMAQPPTPPPTTPTPGAGAGAGG